MKKIIVFNGYEEVGKWNKCEWNEKMWKEMEVELETGVKYKEFEELNIKGDDWEVFGGDEICVLVCDSKKSFKKCIEEFEIKVEEIYRWKN